jgi:hypothetical protein
MTISSTIILPSSTNVNVRIAWAGDAFQDLLEGLYTIEQGWYIWNLIVGWSDLCGSEDRRQYSVMARIYDEYLKNQ